MLNTLEKKGITESEIDAFFFKGEIVLNSKVRKVKAIYFKTDKKIYFYLYYFYKKKKSYYVKKKTVITCQHHASCFV